MSFPLSVLSSGINLECNLNPCISDQVSKNRLGMNSADTRGNKQTIFFSSAEGADDMYALPKGTPDIFLQHIDSWCGISCQPSKSIQRRLEMPRRVCSPVSKDVCKLGAVIHTVNYSYVCLLWHSEKTSVF